MKLNNNYSEGYANYLKNIKREKVKMPIVDLISDIICNNKNKEEMLSFLIKKK